MSLVQPFTGWSAMKAITIWQPWAWAIAEGLKPVENRTWRPILGRGDLIAIHAGKKKSDESHRLHVEHVIGRRLKDSEIHYGAIVAVVKYRGYITTNESAWNVDKDWVPENDALDAWFAGPIGWVFSDVIKLDPIPCRGSQGIWEVKMPAAFKLAEQLRPHKIAVMLPAGA